MKIVISTLFTLVGLTILLRLYLEKERERERDGKQPVTKYLAPVIHEV